MPEYRVHGTDDWKPVPPRRWKFSMYSAIVVSVAISVKTTFVWNEAAGVLALFLSLPVVAYVAWIVSGFLWPEDLIPW